MSKELETILTVDHFSRVGLETCTSPPTDDRCIICHTPYTNAVRTLACGHIFDRECLISWLKSASQPSSCPMCRQTLIHIDKLPSIISNLLTRPDYTWDHFGLKNIGNIELSTNTVLSVDDLWRVVHEPGPELAVPINAALVAKVFILCGNVVIESARLRDTTFTAEQKSNLGKIVRAGYSWAARRDGQMAEVIRLPMLIATGTIEVLEEDEEHDIRGIFGAYTERENMPDRYLTDTAFMAAWKMWQAGSGEGNDHLDASAGTEATDEQRIDLEVRGESEI